MEPKMMEVERKQKNLNKVLRLVLKGSKMI